MEDIRRLDSKLFIQELLSTGRLIMVGACLMFSYLFASHVSSKGYVVMLAVALVWVTTSYRDSIDKRFINKRMKALWTGCQDRMLRFEEVLKRMKKEQVADLHEMPQTIRGVSDALYAALRRADVISHEVMLSERELINQPPVWKSPGGDPQSQELYRLADKNIAEYRQQFAGVMAGVQRTEAQSAVFMTTLDTLRMKMIGYRLVGRSPELGSHDFLEALAEARAQLQSIDTALDELDLGHYPKTIAVVPPPIPEDATEHLDQR
ncbi:hypothetical protein BH11ARM1_BH11ARM1_08710 [soil metagenome]